MTTRAKATEQVIGYLEVEEENLNDLKEKVKEYKKQISCSHEWKEKHRYKKELYNEDKECTTTYEDDPEHECNEYCHVEWVEYICFVCPRCDLIATELADGQEVS